LRQNLTVFELIFKDSLKTSSFPMSQSLGQAGDEPENDITGGPITPDPVADPPLPLQRAFVVQLHATAVVAQGQLTGRVEHVQSGQAAHFNTLDELLAFMARVLGALEGTGP
jgi:hypothetical protein